MEPSGRCTGDISYLWCIHFVLHIIYIYIINPTKFGVQGYRLLTHLASSAGNEVGTSGGSCLEVPLCGGSACSAQCEGGSPKPGWGSAPCRAKCPLERENYIEKENCAAKSANQMEVSTGQSSIHGSFSTVIFDWPRVLQLLDIPHLPGEGCWILSELMPSSSSSSPSSSSSSPLLLLASPLLLLLASSSSFSSTMSASTSTSTSALPTLRQALRQLPSSVRTAGPTWELQCAPLDLNLGPSQLSVHRWTSTWDLPSSVCTAGPQPGTFPAQCAPLDLNLGPAQLSVHRWTSTAR